MGFNSAFKGLINGAVCVFVSSVHCRDMD